MEDMVLKEVYFMQRSDGGPIKIGTSGDVAGRLRVLSYGLNVDLVLLASAPGSFFDEQVLHRRFAAIRQHGEWFSDTEELQSVIRYVKRHGKLPKRKIDDRDSIMARRYEAGETLNQIGLDYGMSRERVRQILRAAGVPSKGFRDEHKKKSRAARNPEALANAFKEGKTAKEVAEELGTTYNTIMNVARRNGITPPRQMSRKMADAHKRAAEIAQLYQQGETAMQIAKKYNIDATYVYTMLRIAGVKARQTAAKEAMA